MRLFFFFFLSAQTKLPATRTNWWDCFPPWRGGGAWTMQQANMTLDSNKQVIPFFFFFFFWNRCCKNLQESRHRSEQTRKNTPRVPPHFCHSKTIALNANASRAFSRNYGGGGREIWSEFNLFHHTAAVHTRFHTKRSVLGKNINLKINFALVLDCKCWQKTEVRIQATNSILLHYQYYLLKRN